MAQAPLDGCNFEGIQLLQHHWVGIQCVGEFKVYNWAVLTLIKEFGQFLIKSIFILCEKRVHKGQKPEIENRIFATFVILTNHLGCGSGLIIVTKHETS